MLFEGEFGTVLFGVICVIPEVIGFTIEGEVFGVAVGELLGEVDGLTTFVDVLGDIWGVGLVIRLIFISDAVK